MFIYKLILVKHIEHLLMVTAMSDKKQIKNIMVNLLPSDLVNNVLQFKGCYSALPMCIDIEVANHDYGSETLFKKFIEIKIVDNDHYSILEYEDDKQLKSTSERIYLAKEHFQLYLRDVYIDVIDSIKEYPARYAHLRGAPTCVLMDMSVYFRSANNTREHYASIIKDVDLDIFEQPSEGKPERLVEPFIKLALRKINFLGKFKGLVPFN